MSDEPAVNPVPRLSVIPSTLTWFGWVAASVMMMFRTAVTPGSTRLPAASRPRKSYVLVIPELTVAYTPRSRPGAAPSGVLKKVLCVSPTGVWPGYRTSTPPDVPEEVWLRLLCRMKSAV